MVLAKAPTENNILDRITVRLVREDEHGQFNYYLESRHYLQSSRLAGQSLRYSYHRQRAYFFAAFTASIELPAGLLAVALFVALLVRDYRRTLTGGLIAFLHMTGSFLATGLGFYTLRLFR